MMSKQGEYQVPQWSAFPPNDKYALEVLKQGSIIDEIPLADRDFFLVGRQLDRVDIPAEHPSISRVHAALNFHVDGSLMICDLGSAQGTFVNKKMLAKQEYAKLNVGDVIRFGQSTRLYIVKGPEEEMPAEYDSENLERLRQQAAERAARAQRERERAEQRAGATWGMSMDDEEQDEEREREERENNDAGAENERKSRFAVPDYLRRDEHYDRKYGDKFAADIRPEEIKSKRDEEILDKIRKKERKVQNMQEENRRIFLKEQSQDDGLTEGQLAAVARNDKAIEQLSQEIDVLVNQIRNKNTERSLMDDKKAANSGNKRSRDADESEVLDITSSTADVSTNWRLKKKLNRAGHVVGGAAAGTNSALTYEEVRSALDEMESKLSATQRELRELTQKVQSEQLKSVKDESFSGGMDDIERIISQDLIQEAQKRLKSLHAEEMQLTSSVRQYQRLLAAATPALKSLVVEKPKSTNSNTAVAASQPESSSDASPPKATTHKTHPPTESVDQPTTQATTKPIAVLKAPSLPQQSHDEESDYKRSRMVALEEFKKFVEEENKRAQQISLAASAEKNGADNEIIDASKRAELDRFEKKLKRAVEDEDPDVHPQQQRGKRRSVVGPAKPVELSDNDSDNHHHHHTQPKSVFSDDVLEGGELVWVPPKQQTGDGRTSLNDRFGY